MRILINDDVADVTLENEKTLGEVVASLDGFLTDAGFVISAMVKNGDAMALGDPSLWSGDSLETISDLRIYAQLIWEAERDEYQVLLNFLKDFDSVLKNGGPEDMDAIVKGCAPYFAIIEKTAPSSSGDTGEENGILSRLTQNLKATQDEAERAPLREKLRNLLRMYMIIIAERIKEIQNPMEEFLGIEEMLSRTAKRINDVSMLLQTGKDREAMESIVLFTELSQKAIRLYPLLVRRGFLDEEDLFIDEKPLSDYYEEMNTILSDMLKSFESQDSVLLGDLLEYEISPRIEKLIAFIRRFKG